MENRTYIKIIRITGKKPTECSCAFCRSRCKTPCLGTPDDIIKIIDAGYSDKLKLSLWSVGFLLGLVPFPIPMIQPAYSNEGCAFFINGLCELHSKGLKPTEGKLTYHTLSMEDTDFRLSISWNVAKEWLLEENVEKICYILSKLDK